MKNYIVTGAAGFLGMNLVERLLREEDAHIYAVVRPNSPHNVRLAVPERLTLVSADLSEYARLDEMIDEACDVFFHLAWQGGRYDFAAQYGNVADTLGALEAAARLGCRRFIVTGSQAEYGAQTVLITEETCPHPVCAYGAAKLAACVLSQRRAADLGIAWVWGRVFSLYGKYEQAGRMLPALVNSLRLEQPFALSSSGAQNWDYLYAADAADALLALAERGRAGEIYNIAHGGYRPLRDFIEAARQTIAPYCDVAYGAANAEVFSLQPSVEKICRDAGWRPVTDFVDGLRLGYGLLP
ncbi:NAD(P)-dependent oxidoreductase [Selenomonas sp. oral taxon 138]|uniref:NAD-dependent epimerase/dehydratase family protein n=1 Tax=Selenomonas sp. oral taxon 138 TaxID=712532 RepID=UPI0012ED64D1|nr:NAD(P)-dependent oxidoreductase [Selenomonas sp. oral taxon 138]